MGKKCTIHDIMSITGCSRRTAYRVISRLRAAHPQYIINEDGRVLVDEDGLDEVLPPYWLRRPTPGNPWFRDPTYQRRLRYRRRDIRC